MERKIWLMGGFGNTLFQILARNVLEKKGEKVEYVEVLTQRNYVTKGLGWTIHESLYKQLISENEFYEIGVNNAMLPILVSYFTKIFPIKNPYAFFYRKNIDLSRVSKHVFGYFQEKRFLKENEGEILKLGIILRKKYKREDRGIVVHYRKGDSGWAKDSYYNKVKEFLRKEKERITIVTDSLEDAREYFECLRDFSVVKSKNDIDDFAIMLSAKRLYCAPSTFSWWAAHGLGEQCEVFFPKMLDEKLGIYVKCKYKLI